MILFVIGRGRTYGSLLFQCDECGHIGERAAMGDHLNQAHGLTLLEADNAVQACGRRYRAMQRRYAAAVARMGGE